MASDQFSPQTKCQLSEWGLPPLIVSWFRKKGITSFFQWQVDCLSKNNVLLGGNLVYSAPTSAGKTLVADFLLIKKVLEYGKKALVIEPFVALTREKATNLKSMLFHTKARVGAFGGNYYVPGGLTAVSVAVCTIEKANNIVNKLINENKLDSLGIIVVDEIHYLGDERRGAQLELLLTKVLYYNSQHEPSKQIQIVGLSATIPNLKSIASWLGATLYVTDYRPVPLEEKIKVGPNIYEVKSYLRDPCGCKPLEIIRPTRFAIEKDHDDLFYLCIDCIINGHSCLVFCESKRECELMASYLAQQILTTGQKLDSEDPELAQASVRLRANLSPIKVKEVLEKLKKCPAGPDSELVKSLRFGVAFHHAGLTSEEREIIEDGFKNGAIKALMATTTLSSGVNLPARKVIIKSPTMISSASGVFQREMLNPISYRQMIGRAGRQGIDTCGESVLICRPDNQDIAFKLIKSSLGDINSSLGHRLLGCEGEPSGLKKAVLEVIANGTAVTRVNLRKYLQSTYWLSSNNDEETEQFKGAILETLRFLVTKKFIEELKPGFYKPTRLGNAVLASGIHPDESLELLQDLIKARQQFCLVNDLHIIYQVTPNDIARTIDLKDWQHYSKIWNNLDEPCQYVGACVGVDEIVIGRRAQGFMRKLSDEKERVYRRFLVALVINDLVNEMQLIDICKKYRLSKANVQQAQRSVAQYAGVISIFCQELGYNNIAALVTPLEPRISFSCQRDLLELIKLNITRPIARSLYSSGYTTIMSIAKGDTLDIEFVVRQLQPFKKEQSFSENESPSMWIPELAKNMTTIDYAAHIIETARNYVEIEYDIDMSAILERKRGLNSTQDTSTQPACSPIKRGRTNSNGLEDPIGLNTSGETSEIQVERDNDCHSDSETSIAMRDKDVPTFVVEYVGNTTREVNKFLDKWTMHSTVSLNFKLEQQVNDQIGQKFINRRKRRRSRVNPTGSQSDEDDEQDSGRADSLDLSHDESSRLKAGLPLRLDIDKNKHLVTKLFACFDDDLTVYVVDNTDAFLMIRDNLVDVLNNSYASATARTYSQQARDFKPIKLYTQNLTLTYKVLYAAFGLDQTTLNRHFEWQSFDVAWWLVNNCPTRGLNNCNSSLSLIAKTKWAAQFHHFLHQSKSRLRRAKSKASRQLVRDLGPEEMGRSRKEFLRLKDVVKAGKTAILQPLINEIIDELRQRDQLDAYQDAETGARLAMTQMMIHGIGLSMKAMRDEINLYDDLCQKLTDIAQKYYAKSNISLTNIRQVARVLYEDLDLKQHLMDHSTVSDISKEPTNGEILDILGQYHPFPRLVQDFRKISKALEALQSVNTYARYDSELDMMRVFGLCDFWHPTGRVSMCDPDLQLINRNFTVSIPAHGKHPEELIECATRRCFVPIKGWIFVAADYSQLELRLLAHFSGDANLLEILNRSLGSSETYDVFKTMAARIYEIDDVTTITAEQRQHAKQICYGIIYGMGNRSLASNLHITNEEADKFRQDFFAAFPDINNYIEQQIEQCSKLGYVESLLGRRRTIDAINSEDSSARSRAKRVTINTRIQSSASDIIKLAMKLVNDSILEHFKMNARLVLEMHDELIYEVNPCVLARFAKTLKYVMETLSTSESLKVKLLVNLKKGRSWSDLEKFECS